MKGVWLGLVLVCQLLGLQAHALPWREEPCLEAVFAGQPDTTFVLQEGG